MNRNQKITLQNLFTWIFQPKFFAGIEAELEFEELAKKNGYVVEKISQDRKSFQKYLTRPEKFSEILRGSQIG